MSQKVTFHQLEERLAELIDQVVKTGEEYVVERDGKDCAVLVNARQWRQRTVSRQLDSLGARYRLPRAKQARAEELLAASQQHSLTAVERRELQALLRECDAIMLRRATALDRQP